MVEFRTITLEGYERRRVPNTLLQQKAAPAGLAIVFPGFNFSVDLPLLNLPARLLAERGWDVLLVETNYGRNPDFLARAPEERQAWVEADARAALDAALAGREALPLALIGKSIGTRALAALCDDPRLQAARLVWMTPLIHIPELVRQIERGGQAGLFVIGSADEAYNADTIERLAGRTGSASIVIAGADHGMNIPGDFWGSFRALEEIVRGVERFLRADG